MQAIKTYLLNCSFHGLPFIANKRFHWSERLFWTISVICTWAFSVYIMLSSYEQFKYNAISFTVDTSYLEWKTNFPAVIVCEKGNSKYHHFANEWFGINRDYDTDDILKDVVFFKGGLEGVSYKCKKDENMFRKLCPLASGNYTFYTNTIRSNCQELFSSCFWNDKEFECCQQILPIDTIYGMCYGINSLVSNIKPKQLLPMFVTHTYKSAIGKLTIDLLNPNTKIFVLSEEAVPMYTDDSNVVIDGISTRSHFKEENNVFLSVEEVVNEEEVMRTGIKRRNCRFPEENYLKTARVYSYSSCIVDCLMKLQLESCKCNHHLMPQISQENICDIQGLICLSITFDEMMKRTSSCNCDSSCTETEVNIIGSTTQQNFTKFKAEDATTRINFILQAPTVRCIRKVVNGYLDLIVSMGGTAGLCVGASLLTAVEVVYYFTLRPLSDSRRENEIKRKMDTKKKKLSKNRPPFPFIN